MDLSRILLPAFYQTLYMVFTSSLIATIFGIPLAIVLYITRKGGFLECVSIYKMLSFIINILRSLPFIILMLLVSPFTRFIVGRIIGTTAAIVPIAISATPFVAKLVESNLLDVDNGIVEAAKSMGSSTFQIVKVILIESMPSIVNSIIITIINIVGYSAMAGVIGGGGLGDVANIYGYQMSRYQIMYSAVFIIILIVQVIQITGNYIVRIINKK